MSGSNASEQLRVEVAELRASRERLVLAADADLRAIERELHEGVQQHLVALAVEVQRGEALVDADPAAKGLLQALGRDVQHALDETARLAQRIYAPLFGAGGLAAALRSAAATAGVRASIDVDEGEYSPEVVRTVYLCWLEMLEHAGSATQATISVREEGELLTFEIAQDSAGWGARNYSLRDRVEALHGHLSVRSSEGRATRVSGSLPLARRRGYPPSAR